ncbi:hypothetical protein IE81DRAFT_34620 [Ceraceosorus guamensis]|uniref:Uncharacterized protein n=1 Tax=Ceraceosorus guamensis TaxID=1522189 RepID=A0A316VP45_9BASI|nr:hypothetical protein IE81DRAFT_34620 [Ceraceosorus guamensis]PWN39302.1 hypothetical protein IE81DRAFT_34620 [Ceraceosorus guamensis]
MALPADSGHFARARPGSSLHRSLRSHLAFQGPHLAISGRLRPTSLRLRIKTRKCGKRRVAETPHSIKAAVPIWTATQVDGALRLRLVVYPGPLRCGHTEDLVLRLPLSMREAKYTSDSTVLFMAHTSLHQLILPHQISNLPNKFCLCCASKYIIVPRPINVRE